MSPPVQRPGDRKRFWFSLFYTTTQVFPLINTLVYWAVLVPHGRAKSTNFRPTYFGKGSGARSWDKSRLTCTSAEELELFNESWFRRFWIINVWGITVLIVFLEVMFLNNVKRQVVSSSSPSSSVLSNSPANKTGMK